MARSYVGIAALILLAVLNSSALGDSFPWASHFSTKTPYRVYTDNIPAATAPPAGCSLVFANYIARHGTRNPTSGATKSFTQLEKFVQAHLTTVSNATVKAWLANWRNPFDLAAQGLLAPIGAEEHYGMGTRFQEQYGSLFGRAGYNPLNTTFQNTFSERAALSSQSFAAGLYNGLGSLPNRGSPVFSFNLPGNADPTLRPFDMCPAFDVIDQQPEIESETFLAAHLPSLITRFNTLFGTNTVDNATVKAMMDACRLEYAVFNNSNNFCTLFEGDDFLVFEYYDDLEVYWKRSYGTPLAWKMGSPLLTEMVKAFQATFDKLAAGKPSALTSFMRFAHAETMEPIVTILGLYNQSTPLFANGSYTADRVFRSSWLFPFASNLAMLGYDCQSNPSMSDRFYLKVQHNERDIAVPSCSSTFAPFCSFSDFKTKFATRLNLNLTQLCDVLSPPTPTPSHGSKIWVPIVIGLICVILAFAGGLLVARYIWKTDPTYSLMNQEENMLRRR